MFLLFRLKNDDRFSADTTLAFIAWILEIRINRKQREEGRFDGFPVNIVR